MLIEIPVLIITMLIEIPVINTISVDPDQMPHFVATFGGQLKYVKSNANISMY